MGFRDFKAFNLALLAKQAWRIQQNLGSMVHKVFKAKYFARYSFRKAQLWSRPSYVWRSIMVAMDIIEKGSRWVIGKGKRVHIWEDRWIPTPDSFKVVIPRFPSNERVMVSSLINVDIRSWDVAKVNNTFLPFEA